MLKTNGTEILDTYPQAVTLSFIESEGYLSKIGVHLSWLPRSHIFSNVGVNIAQNNYSFKAGLHSQLYDTFGTKNSNWRPPSNMDHYHETASANEFSASESFACIRTWTFWLM